MAKVAKKEPRLRKAYFLSLGPLLVLPEHLGWGQVLAFGYFFVGLRCLAHRAK